MVAVGDQVTVSPSGLAARVRSIHAQNRPADCGEAGERCAFNLTESCEEGSMTFIANDLVVTTQISLT
jgi:selenocysteine-specific translation elongation factor